MAKLVEFVPITASIPHSGKFMEGTTIDSQNYFGSTHEAGTILGILQKNKMKTISFRDIVKLFNRYLKDARWDKTTVGHRYNQLKEIGCTYPVEYLLFDFCLAALEGDFLDARLYLAHCFHILGLNKSFSLILSVIVNEPLISDSDVRELLTWLAKATEPRNAKRYLDTYGDGLRKRYEAYIEELQKLDNHS